MLRETGTCPIVEGAGKENPPQARHVDFLNRFQSFKAQNSDLICTVEEGYNQTGTVTSKVKLEEEDYIKKYGVKPKKTLLEKPRRRFDSGSFGFEVKTCRNAGEGGKIVVVERKRPSCAI